jgi:SSS family solute:Na+ symporter
MLFWALAGLLAVGMYAGKLNDPDMIWGYMTKSLLVPGAIGLMLVGVLSANMSALAAGAVSYAALFTNNLYKPRYPDKTGRHYLMVGRIVIAASLLGGIGVALFINNLLELFQYIISIPAIFGASIWLGFLWRRVTKWAVIIQVALCIMIYAVIPNLFQQLDAIKYNPKYLIETKQESVVVTIQALAKDVGEGRASAVGQLIQNNHVIPPAGILFERVARIDPENPESPKVGLGRFHAEIWVLSWLGFDFSNCRKSQLVAVRFFFDALFPFVLLFLISLLTAPAPKALVDRFFAKLHTPVRPTPEEDERALAESFAYPDAFEIDKLFRRSQWEILRPAWSDFIGFGGCWLLVGAVIVLLWLMVSIR